MNNPQINNNNGETRCPVHTYPFAFFPLGEVKHYVRVDSAPEELPRLPEIVERWQSLQPLVAEITRADSEAGVADGGGGAHSPIPAEHAERLSAVAGHDGFQKTFGGLRTSFEMVDVDSLIAAQRAVNITYIKSLLAKLPAEFSLGDLIDFCLMPRVSECEVLHLEAASSQHIFTSENIDLRFLGTFRKELLPEDLKYGMNGGLPVAALITFVGFGFSAVNVVKVGSRIVLANGFHRVYALRSRGIKRIPVVMQHVMNSDLELPDLIAKTPKDYLLNAPRPLLMKDFVDERLVIHLKARRRLKCIAVNSEFRKYDIPT